MDTPDEYRERIKRHAPRSPLLKNLCFAFLFGGGICLLGEALGALYLSLGADEKTAGMLVTCSLIFLSAFLTALGVYDNIARIAGAGTLVPVTGFANAVASPAIDSESEGPVFGIGAKIFTIAGPVILYGILSGTIYGVIYYVATLFG